jgi:hypothetical protein
MAGRFRQSVACAGYACWLLCSQQGYAQGTFINHTVLRNPNPVGVFTNEFGVPVYHAGPSFPGVLSVDLNHDGIEDYRVVATGTTTFGFQMEGVGANAVWSRPTGGLDAGGFIVPLVQGEMIGPGVPPSDEWMLTQYGPFGPMGPGFSAYSSSGAIGLFINQTAFAGLQFQIGTELHYGWIRVQEIPGLAGGGIVYDYAYDTRPNTAIFAGAVPEPSAWTLFSIGLLSLAFVARKFRALK